MVGTAEVAVLHHKELIDGIVHGRVEALDHGGHFDAGTNSASTVHATTAAGTAVFVISKLEGRLRSVDW